MKLDKTERGFRQGKFTDRYRQACSIQKSSLATEDCIWLGVDDADPKIMVSDARKLGRTDLLAGEQNGWIPWPIPDEVALSTRMHLTRQQVADLLPILEHFVRTGELP